MSTREFVADTLALLPPPPALLPPPPPAAPDPLQLTAERRDDIIKELVNTFGSRELPPDVESKSANHNRVIIQLCMKDPNPNRSSRLKPQQGSFQI